MPKGRIIERYEEWRAGQAAAQRQRAQERVKLLPKGLAADIIEACGKEREAIKDRIAVLDESEARLDGWIAEATQEKWEATAPVDPEREVTKINARGEEVTVTRGSDGRRISTPESLAIGRKLRRLKQRKATHKGERYHRLRQLAEIRKVQRSAERGVYSAILAVTQNWRNSVEIGGLADQVKMGRSYVDAAGYELPPEALDEDGTPADHGTAREARAAANSPMEA